MLAGLVLYDMGKKKLLRKAENKVCYKEEPSLRKMAESLIADRYDAQRSRVVVGS